MSLSMKGREGLERCLVVIPNLPTHVPPNGRHPRPLRVRAGEGGTAVDLKDVKHRFLSISCPRCVRTDLKDVYCPVGVAESSNGCFRGPTESSRRVRSKIKRPSVSDVSYRSFTPGVSRMNFFPSGDASTIKYMYSPFFGGGDVTGPPFRFGPTPDGEDFYSTTMGIAYFSRWQADVIPTSVKETSAENDGTGFHPPDGFSSGGSEIRR